MLGHDLQDALREKHELILTTSKSLDITDKNHTIEVSSDGSNWKTIKGLGSGTELSETETVAGIHISAYQFDSTKGIPQTGNYYVLPVLSENKVMSAIDNKEKDTNAIEIDYLQGKKVQKWSIEKITNTNVSPTDKQPEYKIVELSGYKALAIQNGIKCSK